MMREQLIDAFAAQSRACEMLGSPLTAALTQFFHDDFVANGVIAKLTADWQGNPLDDNVPLRLAGFVHFKALSGVPEIAQFFQSCGGDYQAQQKPELQQALRDLFANAGDEARQFLRHVPQTNETGRAALLLLGFSEIARRTALPLQLCEMGASAGLNLFFDRFHYVITTPDGEITWGDKASELTICSHWTGRPPPALLPHIPIRARSGCDLSPVDLSNATQSRILQSWVWGDMPERRTRLKAAIAIAHPNPPQLFQADADSWVADKIVPPAGGQCTVLYHSIVWPYLSHAQREAITAKLVQAGQSATADAPLAWLQLDSATLKEVPILSYRLWDGKNGAAGEKIIIGTCHPHGKEMQIDYDFDCDFSSSEVASA